MSPNAVPFASPRAWPAPAAVALGYLLAAMVSLTLTRGADGVATMWPASGVLLAGLLWLPRRLAWRSVALTAVASMVANLATGSGPYPSLVFTAANMSEALIAASLIGRTGERRPSFVDPRDVARFCVAVAVAGGWSAAVACLGVAAPGWLFAASWYATVVLGMLIVVPALLIPLALAERDERVIATPFSAAQAAALLFMVAAVTLATFTQSFPLLFLPLVALLAATYRLGPFGAATGVLIIAVIAPLMTGLGYGSIAQTVGRGEAAVFLLQFYLLVSFAAALPLAALLTAQRRLATQCADSERMHRLLADSSTDIVMRLTPAGVPLYVSPSVTGVLGHRPDEVTGLVTPTIHPDDRARVEQSWTRLADGGGEGRFVFRQRRRRGGYAWLEVAGRLVDAADGTREVVVAVRDVTERCAAEHEAAESRRRLEEANRLLGMAERVAQVGHWRLDVTREAVFWSPEVFRIHGLEGRPTPAYADAIDCYHPDDRARVGEAVGAALASRGAFDTEARLVRPDGEVRHVVLRGQPDVGADGFAGLFGVIQDVTRRVLAEQELDAALRVAEEAAARAIRMADTDALTGAASRRKALAVLDEAIAEAGASGEPLALAIFDIDHFKTVNDRWGHAAGDAVLRRVARAATQAVRPTDLVGRLGGEEFVVVLPGLGAGKAVALAEVLRRAIEGSAAGPEAGPAVTASIGLALLVPGGTAASLLGEADRALYRAKAAGRNVARMAA